MKTALTISNNQLFLHGKPHRILSGAVHYFRVMPEYWEDRLLKLKACGLDTVETYVAWNLHEPRPGEFDFAGRLDLVAYIRLAQKLGLRVIVRPGPYICSEWDFGGLPAWLLHDPLMQVRCAYPPYLEAADRYLRRLFQDLQPLQASEGGPIIAFQIENEYAAYGNDEVYLQHLVKTYRDAGIYELFFTSDHCFDSLMPDVWKTANFGSKATDRFAELRAVQPTGPLACMEFWAGWFDTYGKPRPARTADDLAKELDEILRLGASVNFYMFHGGTNFGFLNGANNNADGYDPRPTSYDFGALLNECGDLTDKYHACREVIARYTGQTLDAVFPPVEKLPLTSFALTKSSSLWDNLPALGEITKSPNPLPMEALGQNFGFILYRTQLRGPFTERELLLREVRDRAYIFVDRQFVGILDRRDGTSALKLSLDRSDATLEILVENMGRANFGPDMHDRKGITHSVLLDRKYLFQWEIQSLPLNTLDALLWQGYQSISGPTFHRGTFTLLEPHDTYLSLPGWTKGVAWINGFNLGRYWKIGPHQTLYIPAPLLKKGVNTLTFFDLETPGENTIQLLPNPIEST